MKIIDENMKLVAASAELPMAAAEPAQIVLFDDTLQNGASFFDQSALADYSGASDPSLGTSSIALQADAWQQVGIASSQTVTAETRYLELDLYRVEGSSGGLVVRAGSNWAATTLDASNYGTAWSVAGVETFESLAALPAGTWQHITVDLLTLLGDGATFKAITVFGDRDGGENYFMDNVVLTNTAGTNTAPVALDDTATAQTGEQAILDVLANDTDADDDALSITHINGVALGLNEILTLGDGSFVENLGTSIGLTATIAGDLSLNYTVTDGTDASVATAIVTVLSPPLPPSGYTLILFDDTLQNGASFFDQSVLADYSSEGDPSLGASSIALQADAWQQVGIAASHAVTTETRYLELDLYRVEGASGSLVVRANYNWASTQLDASNYGRVWSVDGVETFESLAALPAGTWQHVTVDLFNLLGEGAVFKAITVFGDRDGGENYFMDNVVLTDLASGDSANSAPVALDDAVLMPILSNHSTYVLNVLANDTDTDGDTLSITHINGIALTVNEALTLEDGSVAINRGTHISFGENVAGEISFNYTVSDGELSDTATVVVTTRSNRPPVADDDYFNVMTGHSVQIDPLENDRDPDGEFDLTITHINGEPVSGSMTINLEGRNQIAFGSGGITFIAPENFEGDVSFTYTISDRFDATDQATAIVSVRLDSIAGSTDTLETLALGEGVNSIVDFAGDEDWFAVELIEGESYRFTQSEAGINPIYDTYLRLYSEDGTLITYNDDMRGSTESELDFTATDTGTYYISAGGAPGHTGEYRLFMGTFDPNDSFGSFNFDALPPVAEDPYLPVMKMNGFGASLQGKDGNSSSGDTTLLDHDDPVSEWFSFDDTDQFLF